VIAKRSARVCIVQFCAVAMNLAYWILQLKGEVITSGFVYLIFQILLVVIAVFWMKMKMEVDSLSMKQEELLSGTDKMEISMSLGILKSDVFNSSSTVLGDSMRK
jgi:hypothetical protein